MRTIVFYVSGHGFGHASRQIEVINALLACSGPPRIQVVTSAPRWLFDRTVRGPFAFRELFCDPGVVQVDSLTLDVAATIRTAVRFYGDLERLADTEAAWLRRIGASLVVGDVPPLASTAAGRAGVPSVVIGNFTWDWIYAGYVEQLHTAPDLIATVRRAYGQAYAGWRLPMWGGFEAFGTVVDLPLIARHARHPRAEVRQLLALPQECPLALASFGGLGLGDIGALPFDCLDRYGIVVTYDGGGRGPSPGDRSGVYRVDEQRVYGAGLRYEDLVAAVDVVVTKPGYGIIAECVANGTAIVYTSRGSFAEYDVLVRKMPHLLRCAYLAQDALRAGRWRRALDRALTPPDPPARPRTDGAQVAATMICALLG